MRLTKADYEPVEIYSDTKYGFLVRIDSIVSFYNLLEVWMNQLFVAFHGSKQIKAIISAYKNPLTYKVHSQTKTWTGSSNLLNLTKHKFVYKNKIIYFEPHNK